VLNRDITEVANEYGADLTGLQVERPCRRAVRVGCESTEEANEGSIEMYDEVFSLPVRNPFSGERLPHGYGYKGGAARALLLRTLGIDPAYNPRDIDVVRMTWENDSNADDVAIARRFMPEDFNKGAGVEEITDRDEYLTTRDLRMNEILATFDRIECTRGALLDVMRHIIRPTEFERDELGGIESKMLAKILRFYMEAMYRYDEAGIEDVPNWQFDEAFISPFWLAVQLDRACDIGMEFAQQYVHLLVDMGQLPKDIESVEDAAAYLLTLVHRFSYRHAPIKQFEMEDHWAQIDEDKQKRRRGRVQLMKEDRDQQDGRVRTHRRQRRAERRVKMGAKEQDEE
jgi:hypothetical protein